MSDNEATEVRQIDFTSGGIHQWVADCGHVVILMDKNPDLIASTQTIVLLCPACWEEAQDELGRLAEAIADFGKDMQP